MGGRRIVLPTSGIVSAVVTLAVMILLVTIEAIVVMPVVMTTFDKDWHTTRQENPRAENSSDY